MSARRIARTAVPPVGANSFAWHLTGRHLRSGDKPQDLIPQDGITQRQQSKVSGGLIARGTANKFAPTKAARAVGKLIGWQKTQHEYPARAAIQGLHS